jgi:hypothetical protein
MPSAFIISRVALRRVAGHGDPFLSEHHNSFRSGRKKIYKKFKRAVNSYSTLCQLVARISLRLEM